MKMKFAKQFPYLALLTALLMGSGQALAIAQLEAVEGTMGTVYFYGGLLSSPCTLAPESQEQSIDMGDISARSFKRVGDRSEPVVFNLRLEDCLLGVGGRFKSLDGQGTTRYLRGEQAVTVTFLGDSDTSNTELLHLNGDIKGVGLRLFNSKGTPIAINKPLDSKVLHPGDNDLLLSASLESTKIYILANSFNSVLHLKLDYL